MLQVKKRQQRVMMILDSKSVEYEIIDITEPGKELEKEFMQANSNARNNKYPLPPQIFNEDDYCGVIIFSFCRLYFIPIILTDIDVPILKIYTTSSRR